MNRIVVVATQIQNLRKLRIFLDKEEWLIQNPQGGKKSNAK